MTAPAPQSQPEADALRRHTPTPWRLCTKGNIGSAIEAQTGRKTHEWDDGYRIIATYQEGCSSGLYEDLEANRIANGLLIVEAVNSHATLQARVEELTKALEWQPIETAPTCSPFSYDPIEVLLWVADGGFGEERGTVAFGRCYRSDSGRVRAVASGYSGDWKITHWKPMPARPTPSVPLEQSGSGK